MVKLMHLHLRMGIYEGNGSLRAPVSKGDEVIKEQDHRNQRVTTNGGV